MDEKVNVLNGWELLRRDDALVVDAVLSNMVERHPTWNYSFTCENVFLFKFTLKSIVDGRTVEMTFDLPTRVWGCYEDDPKYQHIETIRDQMRVAEKLFHSALLCAKRDEDD